MSIGAIAVPLNPSYSVDKMAYVLDDASPVLVVTDRATGGERLEELRRAGGCLVLEDLTKMGASGSLLIAMMVLEVCMPARCCIAPEIPTGDVQLRADGLAGLPDLELVRVPAGVGRRVGRADRRAQAVGELLDDREPVRRPGAAPAPDRVRWAINGQEHCKSFKSKTLADGFLDNLKDAARDRRPFSPRAGHGVTVQLKIYAHCIDGQAAHHRRPRHHRRRARTGRRGRRRR
jgi:hypothetical protein